jgi:hypothetical protein
MIIALFYYHHNTVFKINSVLIAIYEPHTISEDAKLERDPNN